MKTRIIYTDIWNDGWFQSLSDEAQKLFLYLITNERIGFTGMYQLPDAVMTAYTRLAGKKLTDAKLRLFPKVLFIDGWVKVVNAERYNPYKGELNQRAQQKELLTVPSSVKGYSIQKKQIVYDGVANTPNNNKSEIINQESDKGLLGEKEELQTVPAKAQGRNDSLKTDPFLEWIAYYNSTYNGKFKGSEEMRKNFDIWFKLYSMEEMKEAVKKIRYDKYWGDKHSPTILLRTRDSNGPVDRIGDMLNQRTKGAKPQSELSKITDQIYGTGTKGE